MWHRVAVRLGVFSSPGMPQCLGWLERCHRPCSKVIQLCSVQLVSGGPKVLHAAGTVLEQLPRPSSLHHSSLCPARPSSQWGAAGLFRLRCHASAPACSQLARWLLPLAAAAPCRQRSQSRQRPLFDHLPATFQSSVKVVRLKRISACERARRIFRCAGFFMFDTYMRAQCRRRFSAGLAKRSKQT